MRVKFLGTGADDSSAVKTCSCKNCAGIRQLGGRSLRRQSSILLDSESLIDCGPQVFDSLREYGVEIGSIKHLLLTHSHEDHLDVPAIARLSSFRPGASALNVYGHASVLRQLPGESRSRLCLKHLEPGKAVQIGSWSVEGLEANHLVEENPGEKALHYLFTGTGRQWFYGVDGCWLLKPAWLRLQHTELDMVILDATLGELAGDDRMFEHNTVSMVKEMIRAFKKAGVLKEEARIVLSHLSLHENPPHELWASQIDAMGFILAYDGLEIQL